ncbi:hypothetical protein ACVINI_007566 [Rhizobium beringeri]|jgi:hypothetical protein
MGVLARSCLSGPQNGSRSVTAPTAGRRAAAVTYFAIWLADLFESEGDTVDGGGRRFCPECGSRVYSAERSRA